MTDYLVVGAGISGLIAARILKSLGREFIGLEREEKAGGRTETGHHRILNEKSVEFLKRWTPIEWSRIDEDPQERKKGEWVKPETSEEERENFYLCSNFYHPQTPFSDVMRCLGEPVLEQFQFRKTVEKVDSEKKIVTCQDGTEYPFKNLIWCSDLALLRKLWSGSDSELLKSLKKSISNHSGLNLDFTLKSPLFPNQNSVLFPFRFKDERLRAIGIQDTFTGGSENDGKLHWIIFLDNELSEDREEVAKVVRTFKRELQKEFPQFSENIRHEKITFLPSISGDEPLMLKSLEISPGVIYLGPQSKLKDEEEENAKLMNIDRTILNCGVFELSLRTPP